MLACSASSGNLYSLRAQSYGSHLQKFSCRTACKAKDQSGTTPLLLYSSQASTNGTGMRMIIDEQKLSSWMPRFAAGIRRLIKPKKASEIEFPLPDNGGGGINGGSLQKFEGGGDGGEDPQGFSPTWILATLLFAHLFLSRIGAFAEPISSQPEMNTQIREHDVLNAIWEVRSGQWRQLLVDSEKDEFVMSDQNTTTSTILKGHDELHTGVRKPIAQALAFCFDLTRKLMLPDGYPQSVTGDYLEYTLWRAVQGVASQVSSVLSTQAMLYAIGLGKGAIPTAAAINWVLKDGIGYLSKIVLSKYGRHFDVHPKSWRLLADLLENAACGLELLTSGFPHLFVYLGAMAGAGRSAAGLIQASTRSCFYAGFASQRNFADVIAKGEAQGMISRSVGILVGIALSSYIGSSGPALVAAFTAVTGFHMFCNLKSYQAVQLRTLNPYRASLVFGEYLRQGVIPSVSEVNAEEPFFSGVSWLQFKLRGSQNGETLLSSRTKNDALILDKRLELGASFGDLIRTQKEAESIFKLYKSEKYVLAVRDSRFIVLLKKDASASDLLRMMLQVSYLHHLQTDFILVSRGVVADCAESGVLKLSLDFMEEKFDQVKEDLISAHWITDGLVCRPKPYRLLNAPNM